MPDGLVRTVTNAYPRAIAHMVIVIDRLNVCVKRGGVGRIVLIPSSNQGVHSRILAKTMACATTLPWATIIVIASKALLDAIVRISW
jgi:hypothetical protein